MKKFSPPSLEEVRLYFLERSFYDAPNQAEAFYDYFMSIGWLVGKKKAPMQDWQAASRTWNRNAKQYALEHGKKIQETPRNSMKKEEPKKRTATKDEVREILGDKTYVIESLFAEPIPRTRTSGVKPLTELMGITNKD